MQCQEGRNWTAGPLIWIISCPRRNLLMCCAGENCDWSAKLGIACRNVPSCGGMPIWFGMNALSMIVTTWSVQKLWVKYLQDTGMIWSPCQLNFVLPRPAWYLNYLQPFVGPKAWQIFVLKLMNWVSWGKRGSNLASWWCLQLLDLQPCRH